MSTASSALTRWPFFRLEGRHLVVAIVLGINALLYLFTMPDPDYYWHLKTGQYILETGSLPVRDDFSYTAGDRPWILHEWIAQLLMATIEGRFGFAGLVIFFSFLSTFAFFLEYRLLRRLDLHPLLAAVFTFVSMLILFPFISVRPLIYTWVFLMAYLLVLYPYHRRDPVEKSEPARLWLLPVLMAPWVNLHGGFLIGIVLIALLLAVRGFERIVWRRQHTLLPLAVTLVAAFLATFANPSGLQGLLYPLTYLGGDNASREFITEWQSPNFHIVIWMILLGLPILGAVAVGLTRASLGLWPFVLFAMTTVMALQSIRFVPIFGLVAIPALAEALRERASWARTGTLLTETGRGYLLNWTVLLSLAALALLTVPRLPFYHLGGDPFRGKSSYPEQGATIIGECYPTARMYNGYGWGGYLIWRLYPEQKVFIDGRADLHGAKRLNDYIAIARLRPGWRELLDTYEVNLVIFEKEAPLSVALALDQTWQRVFEGPAEAIFVRKGPTSLPPPTCNSLPATPSV